MWDWCHVILKKEVTKAEWGDEEGFMEKERIWGKPWRISWIWNMVRTDIYACQAQDEPKKKAERDRVRRAMSSLDAEQAAPTHSGGRKRSKNCQSHMAPESSFLFWVSDPHIHLSIGCPHLNKSSNPLCSQFETDVPYPTESLLPASYIPYLKPITSSQD